MGHRGARQAKKSTWGALNGPGWVPADVRDAVIAIDYVTPADRLAGRHAAITAERDRRLEAARERRAQWRQAARGAAPASPPSPASLDSHP